MYNAFIPNITRKEKALKKKPKAILDDGRTNYYQRNIPKNICKLN